VVPGAAPVLPGAGAAPVVRPPVVSAVSELALPLALPLPAPPRHSGRSALQLLLLLLMMMVVPSPSFSVLHLQAVPPWTRP